MLNGQTWDIAEGSWEQVGPRSIPAPRMLSLESHEELRKWNLAHGPPTLAQAPTWAQLRDACALHPNAQMPRVPCMPRRKATMLESSGDGIADLLLLDSTGDGVADQPVSSVAVDTTGDGRTDALIADSNGDGRGDCLVLDTSGDGIPDTAVVGMLVDTDNDGQADVLLVDTTGDGVADTLVQIYGVGQQGGPQQSKPPRQSAAPRHQASSSVHRAPTTTTPTTTTLGKRTRQGWTEEEDEQIVSIVQESGPKWCLIARQLPGRSDDAVRNRWKRLQGKTSKEGGDMWSPEQDAFIQEMVMMHGNKWTKIADMLPDRSHNAVRNRLERLLKAKANTNVDQS